MPIMYVILLARQGIPISEHIIYITITVLLCMRIDFDLHALILIYQLYLPPSNQMSHAYKGLCASVI